MNIASTIGGPALALRSHVSGRMAALSPRKRKAADYLAIFGIVGFATLVSAEPALAQSNLDSFAESVLGLLSNGLLRTIAVLAVIAAGFGWLTGRVNTTALVTVIIGIAIIFSAPWIVDQLNGGG